MQKLPHQNDSDIRLKSFIKGFMVALPLGVSVFIYGIVFGVLSQKAGLSSFETLGMSCLIFAGASQITAVQMISQGGTLFTIIITVFIINLRHFLMAASLTPYLKKEPTGLKLTGAYFLTDESFAITYSHFQANKPSAFFFLGSGLNIYLFWCAATITGFLFGHLLPDQLKYVLDFAFAAAFIGMLIPLIQDFPTITAVFVSAAISIWGYRNLPGKWYIIIAVLIASLFGYLVDQLQEYLLPPKERSDIP
ncbi:MAG TPA: branched-chain amino acid ABC transporter permease [Firmicutes bacterium]|jgi:4-azaleucine resistance transporter AzlC|nr:branched-chain amino acid ABC transporter permease [Bacillota bacterium]